MIGMRSAIPHRRPFDLCEIYPAGRDTTAGTLTFIIYFLSCHPEVLARLRDEIITKVGHSRRPDYDDVKDMKYLRAVINGMYVPELCMPFTT